MPSLASRSIAYSQHILITSPLSSQAACTSATLALRRGRIVDRSPRAADVPEMKRAGLVAAVIQPLVY
jgi:hypothetical protein